MTDVLKIALERRSKLQDEVDKLDDFIRMAETLIRNGGAPAQMPASAPAATPAPSPAVAETSTDTKDQPSAESEESPMRAAMRRLSDGDSRNTGGESSEGTDVPRPSIIRRGMAG